MKLLKLKLLSSFRGLQEGFNIEFNSSDLNAKSLQPICFVGQNGSGKSNVMEVLSEIFYELELMHLNYASDNEEDDEKETEEKETYGYELEYLLPLGTGNLKGNITARIDAYQKIRVERKIGDSPVFYRLIKTGEYFRVTDRNERKKLLPTKIIGYSSGMNELISSPFIMMRFNYFHEYEMNMEEDIMADIEDSRMFYMDYETNSLILISNYLIHDDEKINIINEILNVNKLHSFRIVIRLTDYLGDEIKKTATVEKIINNLKKCATCYKDELQSEKKIITLDFFASKASHEAFKYYFKTASELYRVLYLLNSLNIYSIPNYKREKIMKSKNASTLAGLVPKTTDDNSVFRIENILLYKNGVAEPIHYKKFSDGEHQLMQTIGALLLIEDPGALFLLDEPETHFNPQWRSKFVSTLNKITENEVLGRQQELILTTHSPFILSDCQTHNVYKFDRNDGNVTTANPRINTYGASIDVLYEEVFGQENTISDLANSEIERLKNVELDDIEGIEHIEEIRRLARQFGESSEKFELLDHLSRLRREYEKKQRG